MANHIANNSNELDLGDTDAVLAELNADSGSSEDINVNGNYIASAPDTADDSEALAGIGDNLKPQLKEFWRKVYAFGRDDGKGKRSLVALAEHVTHGAMDLGLTFKDNRGKRGPSAPKSDGENVYDKFRKASAKETNRIVADQDEGSRKAQVSKLNAFIKLGNISNNLTVSDDGEVESAIDLLTHVRTKHVEYMGDGKPGGKRELLRTKATYDAMLAAARKQNDSVDASGKGQWLSLRAVDDVLLDLESNKLPPTAVELLKDAWLTIQKVQKGKKDKDGNLLNGIDGKPEREPVEHEGLEHAAGYLRIVMDAIDPTVMQQHFADEKAKTDKKNKAAADKRARDEARTARENAAA